ncbi:MAG TPA: hypothetical protein VEX62_09710 [Candidatus Limnocylindrales bacterium]|nr:hypothetical protein [Candidatus Limnocylindrales bacterium]
MASRQQRRQGVVYGPARPSTPGSGGGAILGRILGLFVLVMAVALLGVGVFTFLGGGATPTPLRTPIARASSSLAASALPTSLPTGTALTPTQPPASQSPSASTDPGFTASPSPPLIQVGPGFVTFGTRADNDLNILDPRTSFTSDERITWSAYLIDTVDAAEVRVLVIKADPSAPGGERLVSDEAVTPATTAQIFIRRIRPPRFLDGPGYYTVRYVRAERLLAEGYFVVAE